MRKFLGFMSLTTASQICLLANQLVLLPLQLAAWGHDLTATWFVVFAVANLATVADLGMRNAGHADLLGAVADGDAAAARRFAGVWALTRLLFVGTTLVIMSAQMLSGWLDGAWPEAWMLTLTVAIAIETLIIVRGMWADSLGHFTRVEAIYLSVLASRTLLSILALVLFAAPPPAIAWLMLASALAGLLLQARAVTDAPLRLLSLDPGDMGWQSLRIIPLVIVEPLSNWTRLSLPVLVLSSFGSAALVTTYVALRAIYGLARQVINQISRYGSVSYARLAGSPRATVMAVRAIFGATLIAAGVSLVTILDNARLLGLWLKGAEPAMVNLVALSFGIGAAAYGYQLIAGVMMRTGQVRTVATRQYAYLACSAMIAVAAQAAGSSGLYLVLLPIPELLIAALFAPLLGRRVMRGLIAAVAMVVVVIGAAWTAVRGDAFGLFSANQLPALAASFALMALLWAATVGACWLLDRAMPAEPATT